MYANRLNFRVFPHVHPRAIIKIGGLNLEKLVVSAPPGRARGQFYWAGEGERSRAIIFGD